MKQFTYSILLLLLAIGCKNKTADHSQHNTDNMKGMEGMNMSTMNHDSTAIDSFLFSVVNPVNEIVISNQETIKPTIRELGNNISTEGYIAFDERRYNKISMRFGGRIEKLYVKYNYQYVKKGEKIMELYSPELNTIEEEYIHHLKNVSDNDLVQITKKKMLLLGISESEILTIEKTRKPLDLITIYNSYEGYVLFDATEAKGNSNSSFTQNGMNMGIVLAQNKYGTQVSSTQIKEGSYVNEGQTLFIVNDFKEVWAIAAFDSKEESQIKINSSVKVSSELTGDTVSANINFIEPVYKAGQKFTQARIYLKNEKQQYKINSLVIIQVSTGEKKMSVPGSAVLDLGKMKIVWVKTGKKQFEARNVITGGETKGLTEIISGITGKDEIAKDAGYLIDSESLIKSK